MHIDEFNEQFEPFYAQFGYFGSVHLPTGITPLDIASGMQTRPDDATAVAMEYLQVERRFVRLFWRSLGVGDFDCSEELYLQELIPDSVIEAANTYMPPLGLQ